MTDELLWSQIVARAWCDEDFMSRLLTDPLPVLAEYNLDIPFGMEAEVTIGTDVKVEDSNLVRRFILPARPLHELTEEDLVGDAVAYCYCGACGRCGGCGCRCRC